MQVYIVKNAGFCAGVKRALNMAEKTADEPGIWHSLGPLVHNAAVIDYLKVRGINPVDDLQQLKDKNSGIIIRSHGVGSDIIKTAEGMGIKVIDATCPLVSKVHKTVRFLLQEDYEIFIFGDINHPEVIGILGWCDNKATVINEISQTNNLGKYRKIALVSQTTKDEEKFYEIARALLTKAEEVRIFNTICSATRKRVEQTLEICRQVELMLVIGDKQSSNTATLTKECLGTGVKTIQIESADEIEMQWFAGVSKAGITAGASTPDWIIKEVLDRMTAYDEKENQEVNQEMEEQEVQQNQENEPANELQSEVAEEQGVQNQEESFATMEAEMADIASPGKGDVIKGTVVQVNDDEVMVDVGGKSEGLIPLREISAQEVNSAREIVQVGDEIEVLVLKWDDDGNILLSKKKVDTKRAMDKLEDVFNEGRTVLGKVTGSVKGGLLVDIGITSFLPASHIGDGYVKNLEEYIGREMEFNIIEFNRNKRRGSQVVISRKELAEEEKRQKREEFWNSIETGQIRVGKVKRIIDYGAFLDLGGYEGLLHISELDYRRIPHPSDVLTEGEEIEVYILGVDREKDRVSLSRKKLMKSPWEVVMDKYSEGEIIKGKVVRTATFGAFIEVEPGVDGLVHISQLADYRVDKPENVVEVGQEVNVKILSIDNEQKRISLSIKEAQVDVEAQEVEEYLQKQDEMAEEPGEEAVEPEVVEINETEEVAEISEPNDDETEEMAEMAEPDDNETEAVAEMTESADSEESTSPEESTPSE